MYVFDKTFFQTTKRGTERFSAGRAKFVLECVEDLKKSLRERGSDLLVRSGSTVDVIRELTLTGANERTVVLTQEEVTSEETNMDRVVERMIKDRARSAAAATMEAAVGLDALSYRRHPVRCRGWIERLTRRLHAVQEKS